MGSPRVEGVTPAKLVPPESMKPCGCNGVVLASSGVEVEVVTAAKLAPPRIEDADGLGALQLFHMYADEVGMTPEARARGLTILEVQSSPHGQIVPQSHATRRPCGGGFEAPLLY